jgi:HNH endonuclease
MKLELAEPYKSRYRLGYLVTDTDGRKKVVLFNSEKDRTSTLFSRYLLSVSLGRFLGSDEHVDHINDDRTDDRLENLQILTVADNVRKSNFIEDKLSHIKHGTLNGYRYCKCDLCRKAKAEWTREYRRKKK